MVMVLGEVAGCRESGCAGNRDPFRAHTTRGGIVGEAPQSTDGLMRWTYRPPPLAHLLHGVVPHS